MISRSQRQTGNLISLLNLKVEKIDFLIELEKEKA